MITMNELVDLRMQQQIAHEIYRQQIMQRIPDPFPPMLPIPMPRHVILPPRVTLPGVEVTLQNDDLWKQFHHIGTEMIITKSGRRMFPSMRLSLAGLDDESNYCVLLEMVPIGDCRFKFSGSQWVPAGGAEPQSPQRMFLHPDSPASGAHWQAQPILFSKVKLTNNTLDSNGHVVLASMHKYQPRIHIIRTADLAQIPWAPQQAFVFPETEFVAVTAYQNDRITKLKIDNNPFAKGFRETGQSRCKRKMSSSLSDDDQEAHTPTQGARQHQQQQQQQAAQQRRTYEVSPTKCNTTNSATDSRASSICSDRGASSSSTSATNVDVDDSAVGVGEGGPPAKRKRSNDSTCSPISSYAEQHDGGGGGDYAAGKNDGRLQLGGGGGGNYFSPYAAAVAPPTAGGNVATSAVFMHHLQQNMQTLLRPSLALDLARSHFFGHHQHHLQQQHRSAATMPLHAVLPPTQTAAAAATPAAASPPTRTLPIYEQHMYELAARRGVVEPTTTADCDGPGAAAAVAMPPTFQLPEERLLLLLPPRCCSPSEATEAVAAHTSADDPHEIVVNVECCDIDCEAISQSSDMPPQKDATSGSEDSPGGKSDRLAERVLSDATTKGATAETPPAPRRKGGFSISAILGGSS